MSDAPNGLPSDGWLIHKNGRGYYRPNAQGYTSNTVDAGRYTYKDAMLHSHPNGMNGPRDGMSIKHESQVKNTEAYIRADIHAAEIAKLQAQIDAERAKVAALVKVLEWYAEQSRLARLIHSEGDVGRNALAKDGGAIARAAITAAKGESHE